MSRVDCKQRQAKRLTICDSATSVHCKNKILANSIFVEVDQALNKCGTELESAHNKWQRSEFNNMLKFFGRLFNTWTTLGSEVLKVIVEQERDATVQHKQFQQLCLVKISSAKCWTAVE